MTSRHAAFRKRARPHNHGYKDKFLPENEPGRPLTWRTDLHPSITERSRSLDPLAGRDRNRTLRDAAIPPMMADRAGPARANPTSRDSIFSKSRKFSVALHLLKANPLSHDLHSLTLTGQLLEIRIRADLA